MLLQAVVSLIFLGLIKTNVEAQVCTTGFCGLNGNCIVKDSIAVCECKTGYVGSKCQFNDPCLQRPCGTKGACYPVVQAIQGTTDEKVSYFCQCYSGFSGANCQNVAPTPCSSRPCLNNGVCVEKPNTLDYYCNCPASYTGSNCGTFLDYCANSRCENGGLCVQQPEYKNYTCSCISGFYGTFCEIEINECLITVDTQITSPCLNDATCYDLIDGYFCSCNGPYAGQNCETYVSPCLSNPCGVGSYCVADGASYVCNCQPGYFGNPCQPNPCLNNPCKQPTSQCIPVESGALTVNTPGCTCNSPVSYVCLCSGPSPQYAGKFC